MLGLDRFGIPNEMGSSHGLTRIIRLANMEHPDYIPLRRRSYELWRALGRDAGEQLLSITGSVDARPEDGRIFSGSLRPCEAHGLDHQVL